MNKLNIFKENNDVTLKQLFISLLSVMFIYILGYNFVIFGVDKELINSNTNYILIQLLTGGSSQSLSLFALGVSPFITAKIIVSLLESDLSKQVGSWRELGDLGKKYKNRLTYGITIVVSIMLSLGLVLTGLVSSKIFIYNDILSIILIVSQLTLGVMILSYFAQKLDDMFYFLGTGFILTVGIILNYINIISIDMITLQNIAIFGVLGFVVVSLIIFMNSSYYKFIGTCYNYNVETLDQEEELKINFGHVGVVALIFVTPIMALINYGINNIDYFSSVDKEFIRNLFDLSTISISTIIVYFVSILFFAMIYMMITFDVEHVANMLYQKGFYIYNVAPGNETEELLGKYVWKIGFIGGFILALIVILPYIVNLFVTMPLLYVLLSTSLVIVGNTVINLNRAIYVLYKQEKQTYLS